SLANYSDAPDLPADAELLHLESNFAWSKRRMGELGQTRAHGLCAGPCLTASGQCARVIPKPSKAVIRSIEMPRAEYVWVDCSGSAGHSGRHLASDTARAKIERCLLCR